jgi:hypothetical protein
MKTIECIRASEYGPHLSAHGMAALMLLRHSQIQIIMGTADVAALQKAGLAELIESEIGE